MKYDAIVGQGYVALLVCCPTSLRVTTYLTTRRIPIHERVELPEHWIPADSRVEIDAKITAGKTGRPYVLGPRMLHNLMVD